MTSKKTISTIILTILILFKMEVQAQSFKKIETAPITLEVFNASENSFGVASVIVSGKTDAVLIDAQFTLADAELVAQKIKNSGKKAPAVQPNGSVYTSLQMRVNVLQSCGVIITSF